MSNKPNPPASGDVQTALVEQVLVKGDLKELQPDQRLAYYRQVCESLGLNPLTQPFAYITLSGRLTLYARKDCTDQLRKLNKISITVVSRETVEGVLVVTARATDPQGRSDEEIGAVNVKGLAGEPLANAFMKAHTKAKRRVTLSICGLGFLDETEVGTVPDAEHVTVAEDGEIVQQPASRLPAPATKPQRTAKPPPAKVLPPKDAAELRKRLEEYDRKLAAEGKIKPGALLSWLKDCAAAEWGIKMDFDLWSPEMIPWATEAVKRYTAELNAGQDEGSEREPAAV